MIHRKVRFRCCHGFTEPSSKARLALACSTRSMSPRRNGARSPIRRSRVFPTALFAPACQPVCSPSPACSPAPVSLGRPCPSCLVRPRRASYAVDCWPLRDPLLHARHAPFGTARRMPWLQQATKQNAHCKVGVCCWPKPCVRWLRGPATRAICTEATTLAAAGRQSQPPPPSEPPPPRSGEPPASQSPPLPKSTCRVSRSFAASLVANGSAAVPGMTLSSAVVPPPWRW